MTIRSVLLASSLLFTSQAFASDGVIMGKIRGQIRSVQGGDAMATTYARFGFAMGMYATENRVVVQSLVPDQGQQFHFRKFNDQRVWQNCMITYQQLQDGKFEPACN